MMGTYSLFWPNYTFECFEFEFLFQGSVTFQPDAGLMPTEIGVMYMVLSSSIVIAFVVFSCLCGRKIMNLTSEDESGIPGVFAQEVLKLMSLRKNVLQLQVDLLKQKEQMDGKMSSLEHAAESGRLLDENRKSRSHHHHPHVKQNVTESGMKLSTNVMKKQRQPASTPVRQLSFKDISLNQCTDEDLKLLEALNKSNLMQQYQRQKNFTSSSCSVGDNVVETQPTSILRSSNRSIQTCGNVEFITHDDDSSLSFQNLTSNSAKSSPQVQRKHSSASANIQPSPVFRTLPGKAQKSSGVDAATQVAINNRRSLPPQQTCHHHHTSNVDLAPCCAMKIASVSSPQPPPSPPKMIPARVWVEKIGGSESHDTLDPSIESIQYRARTLTSAERNQRRHQQLHQAECVYLRQQQQQHHHHPPSQQPPQQKSSQNKMSDGETMI